MKVTVYEQWKRGRRVERPKAHVGELGLMDVPSRADLITDDSRLILDSLMHPRLSGISSEGFFIDGFQEILLDRWERQTWYCVPYPLVEGER
jgi:hypothetical protein